MMFCLSFPHIIRTLKKMGTDFTLTTIKEEEFSRMFSAVEDINEFTVQSFANAGLFFLSLAPNNVLILCAVIHSKSKLQVVVEFNFFFFLI